MTQPLIHKIKGILSKFERDENYIWRDEKMPSLLYEFNFTGITKTADKEEAKQVLSNNENLSPKISHHLISSQQNAYKLLRETKKRLDKLIKLWENKQRQEISQKYSSFREFWNSIDDEVKHTKKDD
jgi:uncharacterized protein YlaN (UPF0358 family)